MIYELNPRGFTSPRGTGDGSGSGTFASLAERLSYLASLGVTGIWLAGYCLATNHFYGVWSVYATSRPDVIDPALGGESDLRVLTEKAHNLGLKVFLDVVSHGVVKESPLVQEHPSWFKEGSWGMADYDYGNDEFRTWWVETWVSYVRDFGIDGFRVDIDLGDVSLWDEITERAARADHPIAVFPENGRYHFCQRDTALLSPDVGRSWLVDDTRFSAVQVSCHDNGWQSPPGNYYSIRGSRSRFAYGALLSHWIPVFYAGEEFDADQTSLPNLTRGLYGTGGPGGWLYGSQMNWSQLDLPNKAAMLADVREILRIRYDNRDVLSADRSIGSMTPIESDIPGLMPYARYVPGERAIVIVPNEQRVDIVHLLQLPLAEMGIAGAGKYRVTDLRSGNQSLHAAAEVAPLTVPVRADYAPGGGIRVLEVEPK